MARRLGWGGVFCWLSRSSPTVLSSSLLQPEPEAAGALQVPPSTGTQAKFIFQMPKGGILQKPSPCRLPQVS